MLTRRLLPLVPLCLLLTLSPSFAATDSALDLLRQGFSYLAPHLLDALSPLPEDRSALLPPDTLLASLRDESVGVAKGLDPQSEDLLARALLSLPLRQRVLKVAVAQMDGKRLALVKLQAGDVQSGLFRICDLQDDAVSSLRVAFALPLGLSEIDLWSVVPGKDKQETIHQPIFSVCAGREAFYKASVGPKEAKDILGGLGLVRFAPEFLRYAGGANLQDVAPSLPDTAWSVAPVSQDWGQLKASCAQDPRLPRAALARVVVNLPTTDNSVALTIDDGPHPLITPLFLDVLRRHNTKATFFVVGEKVEECPELLRRTAEEGHEIGNHTYSHPRLSHVSDVEALTQIRACALAIGKVCGQTTHLVRPPGGGLAEHVLRAATAANCTVVLWTHNTNDWTLKDPEQIAANALRDLKPGSIILMHQGEMESVYALELILKGLEDRGLHATTVGEMLARSPVKVLPIPEIMELYKRHQLEKE